MFDLDENMTTMNFFNLTKNQVHVKPIILICSIYLFVPTKYNCFSRQASFQRPLHNNNPKFGIKFEKNKR